jgi:hypothetical protein
MAASAYKIIARLVSLRGASYAFISRNQGLTVSVIGEFRECGIFGKTIEYGRVPDIA